MKKQGNSLKEYFAPIIQSFCFMFLICLFFMSFISAREQPVYIQDVVYGKNGSIIRGMIIEQIPDVSIKIRTQSENVFVFKMEDIEKIVKETSVNAPAWNSRKQAKKMSVKKITGGFKFGLNFASVTGIGNTENKSGFCGGGFITFNISDVFAIQPELLITQKGTKEIIRDWSFFGSYDTNTLKITYLEIPVLAKFSILSKARPNFFIGPALSLKLSASSEFLGNTYDVSDSFNSVDFGLVFGGGFDFGGLVLEARYTRGLTSIVEIGDAKNSVISVMLGYSF